MAGRGRGRGAPGRSQTTFTQEQLNNMGLGGPGMRAEMKQGEIGPPPVFPMLMNKPGPLNIDIKEQYLLMIKRDIVEYLRESSVMQVNKSSVEKSIVQPYGNKYVEILNEKPENNFVWMHLPVELRPNVKRKLGAGGSKSGQPNKKTKNIDIDNRLKILEQRELKGDKTHNTSTGGQHDGDPDGKADPDSEDAVNEEAGELGEGEDQPDEEMDMGTDYVNDYFDNGEGFEDEDDNLDEPCF